VRRTPGGFISSARQSLGLTLEDIRELLFARELETPAECRRVAALLEHRVREIDERVRSLTRFRDRLEQSRRRCAAAGARNCPVVFDLEAATRDERRPEPGRAKPRRASAAGREARGRRRSK
jgi:hypothetical protein